MCIGVRSVATCGALERSSRPTAVIVPVTRRAGARARARWKDEGPRRQGHVCGRTSERHGRGRDATVLTPGGGQGQPEQGVLERSAAEGGEAEACLLAPESTRGGATPGVLWEERARRVVRRCGAPLQQRSAGECSAGPWSVRKSRR